MALGVGKVPGSAGVGRQLVLDLEGGQIKQVQVILHWEAVVDAIFQTDNTWGRAGDKDINATVDTLRKHTGLALIDTYRQEWNMSLFVYIMRINV